MTNGLVPDYKKRQFWIRLGAVLIVIVAAVGLMTNSKLKNQAPAKDENGLHSEVEKNSPNSDIGDLDNPIALTIERNIGIILSSPKESSNPKDYIRAHLDEYENILKLGEEALDYLLVQFERGQNNDLRGQIMMSLAKEILGDRNNVIDETLSPQDWYAQLSIRQEIKLPDFVYDGDDPLEKLVYETEVAQNSGSRGGFTIVAPKIFGSYEEGNKLKVFVTTYSATYRLYDHVLSQEGGSVVPAAITYVKKDDGSYALAEYKPARDGSEFAKSIKQYCTMPVSGKKIPGLADQILDHYGNYSDISALQKENLHKHLTKNQQTGVIYRLPSGEFIPL